MSEEKEHFVREQASLRSRLESAKQQLDEAIHDRDMFELEASKAKRELYLVQEERSVLQVQSFRAVNVFLTFFAVFTVSYFPGHPGKFGVHSPSIVAQNCCVSLDEPGRTSIVPYLA
jgi:hypothetical protein